MDFCYDFVELQSILNYANANICPLEKIQYSGGKYRKNYT